MRTCVKNARSKHCAVAVQAHETAAAMGDMQNVLAQLDEKLHGNTTKRVKKFAKYACNVSNERPIVGIRA